MESLDECTKLYITRLEHPGSQFSPGYLRITGQTLLVVTSVIRGGKRNNMGFFLKSNFI
jgi:hypothetical protein